MISAFVKGVDQLSDPKTRKYVWIALGLALGVFALLWVAVGYALGNTAFFEAGWLNTAIEWLGGAAAVIITILLFPTVISAFVGLFLEGVAVSVEARHYPGLGPAQGAKLGESVVTSLRFLLVMIVLNLLLLPFLLLGPVFPFVFYSVNGYLLGREYFELVALRRLGGAEAQALRKAHGKGVFLAGVLIAFLLTIPIVNLLAPVIGTAAMVHRFETWRAKGSLGAGPSAS